ncbi:unnamed protein product [Phytophthora fragariaefolia]|uniref:Unnamed protein product n=1 Tax=Phytophthora fragariaefolia TaxID=1490495 RepID=A0A9W6XSJ1_9STRA|nr:unnamed protein product [Phytophthora fragariaefolia]
MDITELLNDEGAADGEIELSDEEDAEGAPGDTVANEEEAEESDNEARATTARRLSSARLYGVRFYSVVGWKRLYTYSVWDNGWGNRTRATAAERHVDVFPAVRTATFRTLERDEIPMKRKDASALWVAMCGHLIKTHPDPNQHRLLVCDNFYIRHNLANTVMEFTDGEMKMLGTVRIALQGKRVAKELEAAKARMDTAERGSWELVAALDVPVGWEKL